MKYIKQLTQTFYSVEIDNKYYISDMNGLNKRISEEEYFKLTEQN